MILEIFWSIFKALLICALLAFAYATYSHLKKMRRLESYKAQGIHMMPGYDRFLIGNIKDVTAREATAKLV